MNKLLSAAILMGLAGSTSLAGGAVASADTAFIVPGTSPSPYPSLRAQYHFDPSTQTDIGANYYDSSGATRAVVPYPGSLWPLTGPVSPKLGSSVQQGTNALDARIRGAEGPIVVTGLSQGSLALTAEQARLSTDPTAPPAHQLTFITAGNPNHLFSDYFKPGTTIPMLDYTVEAPVESQYDTVDIVHQYDIFSDPPDRPGNVLALVNAVIAGSAEHTATAFSDPADIPAQNVSVTTNSRGATTTSYFIPSGQLPLTEFLRENGLSDTMAERVDRTLRPMVDRAYGPAEARERNSLRLPDLPRIKLPRIAPLSAPLKAVNTATTAASTVVGVSRLIHNIRKILPGGKKR